MRLIFALILAVITTTVQANSVVDFFSRLEGKWGLLKGSVYLYDGSGAQTEMVITKLTTTTIRTAETEWKFDETYCTLNADNTESCFDTIYFYKLISEKLLLVTSEGTTELKVVNPSRDELSFLMTTEHSSSLTICTFLDDNKMYQQGLSYSDDGSSTAQEIHLQRL